ncbi:MAG TPA: CsgG/HfaB family protein, partial [Abditibacteriaceae bacterium]
PSGAVSLRKERLLPCVARAVLAVWSMPLLFALWATAFLTAAPQRAEAQAAAGIPQTVVLLDFDVAPGLDPVLGRKAADALAVELKSSGNFDVVPRQRVETAVANEPGLRAPFTPQTQIRLAQKTGASSVISGRVIAATVANRKAARVTVEARQLDASTGDVVNGAQVSEATTDKLQEVDNDILLDEAINKVSFAIVRSMVNTRLPEGTVLNVTPRDLELNLGSRNGLAPGQRYSVLRDVQNRATNVVERVKVAEVTISRVESDQSTAVVTAGGDTGVKTGDKVRQIFVPRASYPVSATGVTDSLAMPPVQRASTPVVKKAGKGLAGIGALVLGVGLFGLFGGSSGSRANTSEPTGLVATSNSNQIDAASPTSLPTIRLRYSSGLPAVLAGENVVGYFIYRGRTEDFAATPENLRDFQAGTSTTYSETTVTDDISSASRLRVEIASTGSDDDNGNGGGATTPIVAQTTPQTFDPTKGNTFDPGNSTGNDGNTIVVEFNRLPAVAGVQYFYKVQRVTAVSPLPGQGGGDDDDDDDDDSGSGSSTRLVPALSNISAASGGVTAAVRPIIQSTSGNLDAFTVTA